MIKLAENTELNNYKWIKYDTLKKLEYKVIKEASNSLNVKAIDEFIKLLNSMKVGNEENDSIFENKNEE